MDPILQQISHRPYPLPAGPWRMSQRWNDLLFAHWPVPGTLLTPSLPEGVEVDTFAGSAWLGVVPFWMDQVRVRLVGQYACGIVGARQFPELNLRTYVRDRRSGLPGVYFFSLDAGSLLAVLGARVGFHLPYFWAKMTQSMNASGEISYSSCRLFSGASARFAAQYRGLGPAAPPSEPGSLEHFLMERYCLFTSRRKQLLVGHIHHLPWPLEPASAAFSEDTLAASHGFQLPPQDPVLHFAKELRVFLWPLVKASDLQRFPSYNQERHD